jgi:hypothetical protein
VDALVATALTDRPDLAGTDLFKLLQQATLGAEHAVPDPASAAAWMRREWAALGDGPRVPLVEPLGATGDYVRVNLRPWRDRGGDPDTLTARFVAAAGRPADTTRLVCAVERLVEGARDGTVPLSADSLAHAARAWRAAGFPAVHHSEAYQQRYRPAYRVVARDAVPGLLATLPTRDQDSVAIAP